MKTFLLALAAASLLGCTNGSSDGSDLDGGPLEGSRGDGPLSCERAALSFACGASSCDATHPICCPAAQTCVADPRECARADGGLTPLPRIACDDADDCAAGKVCVASYNKGNNVTDLTCEVDTGSTPQDVPGFRYVRQVCSRSCECLGGRTCREGECR